MPLDVTCVYRKEEQLRGKKLKWNEKRKKKVFDLQCKNQVPGLSATTRRVIDCPAGIWNTSLRIGFACPSTIGSGSEKFTDRPTIMGLCPCKWLFFIIYFERKQRKEKVIKTKENRKTQKQLTKDVPRYPRFG